MNTIAVVILNWNGKKLLEQFLPSVVSYSHQATIYVADNASTDESLAFVKTHYPEIKIISNTTNGGYAKGYNDALQHINEEYLCLLNSDVEVTTNWLKPILDCFNTHKDVAAIQPKIKAYNNKKYFEYAGAAGGFIDKYGFPFCQGRIFDTLEEDSNQYHKTKTIFWASGACFFIRNKAFKELNGFDEDFFAHQEEIDLCWRIQNAGYKIIYTPHSEVYHVGGATLNNQSAYKTYLNFRNSLFVLIKNLPTSKVFEVLFIRMVFDGIAAFKFLLEGKIPHFFAVLKAHGAFYKGCKKMYQKRKVKQHTYDYYYTKSIVLDYFVKKRRHFINLIKH